MQTGRASQNVPLGDGAGHTLPAAAPIARRPDRAGLPVTMLCHSDGKARHDGSRAANKQRCYALEERRRLHGPLGLDARIRNRRIENRMVYYRVLGENRRRLASLGKRNRCDGKIKGRTLCDGRLVVFAGVLAIYRTLLHNGAMSRFTLLVELVDDFAHCVGIHSERAPTGRSKT